ncbi:MAG: hypothetical protein IT440_11625 [Phycisphaeraceae bacterium]|nr:hypothetical protein [Phycisphaeraceae bacterium]
MIRKRALDGVLMLTVGMKPDDNYRHVVSHFDRAGIPIVGALRDAPDQLYRTTLDMGPIYTTLCDYIHQAGIDHIGTYLLPPDHSPAPAWKWDFLRKAGLRVTSEWRPRDETNPDRDSVSRGRWMYRQWRNRMDRPPLILLDDNYIALGFMFEQLAVLQCVPEEPRLVVVEAKEAVLDLPWPVPRLQYNFGAGFEESLDLLLQIISGKYPPQRQTWISPQNLEWITV